MRRQNGASEFDASLKLKGQELCTKLIAASGAETVLTDVVVSEGHQIHHCPWSQTRTRRVGRELAARPVPSKTVKSPRADLVTPSSGTGPPCQQVLREPEPLPDDGRRERGRRTAGESPESVR